MPDGARPGWTPPLGTNERIRNRAIWAVAFFAASVLPAIVGIGMAWFATLSLLFATVGHDEALRSGKSLAAQIPADLAAHVPIFTVQTYDQTLPFYLRRTMVMVDTHSELDYGLQYAPEVAIKDMARFEQTWRSQTDGIAIMTHTTYKQLDARGLPMRVLGKDKRRVAVSRR